MGEVEIGKIPDLGRGGCLKLVTVTAVSLYALLYTITQGHVCLMSLSGQCTSIYLQYAAFGNLCYPLGFSSLKPDLPDIWGTISYLWLHGRPQMRNKEGNPSTDIWKEFWSRAISLEHRLQVLTPPWITGKASTLGAIWSNTAVPVWGKLAVFWPGKWITDHICIVPTTKLCPLPLQCEEKEVTEGKTLPIENVSFTVNSPSSFGKQSIARWIQQRWICGS